MERIIPLIVLYFYDYHRYFKWQVKGITVYNLNSTSRLFTLRTIIIFPFYVTFSFKWISFYPQQTANSQLVSLKIFDGYLSTMESNGGKMYYMGSIEFARNAFWRHRISSSSVLLLFTMHGHAKYTYDSR